MRQFSSPAASSLRSPCLGECSPALRACPSRASWRWTSRARGCSSWSVSCSADGSASRCSCTATSPPFSGSPERWPLRRWRSRRCAAGACAEPRVWPSPTSMLSVGRSFRLWRRFLMSPPKARATVSRTPRLLHAPTSRRPTVPRRPPRRPTTTAPAYDSACIGNGSCTSPVAQESALRCGVQSPSCPAGRRAGVITQDCLGSADRSLYLSTLLNGKYGGRESPCVAGVRMRRQPPRRSKRRGFAIAQQLREEHGAIWRSFVHFGTFRPSMVRVFGAVSSLVMLVGMFGISLLAGQGATASAAGPPPHPPGHYRYRGGVWLWGGNGDLAFTPPFAPPPERRPPFLEN